MYRTLMDYLARVPGAMFEEADGTKRCRYTPHSLRATTATLLDEAGLGIQKIQDLLVHRDIRVTQTYIKLGNDTRTSASHEVPL
ncbi:MAG: tyrosine-type recombinase/integrase [Phycisphaerae bacterium]|jgi:integrase